MGQPAATAPVAASSGVATAKEAQAVTPPDLFDPTHIPTFGARIRTLCDLIVQSSREGEALTVPMDIEADARTAPQPAQALLPPPATTGPSTYAPNIAMGASSEDDAGMWSAEALGPDGPRTEPTPLRTAIVREAQGLHDAFARARSAILAVEGGEMDIEEQKRLLSILKGYEADQQAVQQIFLDSSAPVTKLPEPSS